MKKIVEFLKKETVLSVALILAVISMFIVLPDTEYVGYIDFRTLSILFCLMAVMVGMQEIGLFRFTAEKLLVKVKNTTQLVLSLVLLCFCFSMFITNDVALITFVPFTFIVLRMLGEDVEKRLMIPVVVFQTIAANLGSMLTPMGNPQNLYLYGKSGMGLMNFLGLMLPYTALSLVLLVLCSIFLGKKSSEGTVAVVLSEKTSLQGQEKALLRYTILFVVSLLTVAHVLDYIVCLVIVLVAFLIWDSPLLKKVDYALLLTFIGFFVFIGNMGRVPFFNDLLQKLVAGNEVVTSVISSQIISNVPAALLLSGFTENVEGLIVGTNLGGLGTLIASMASLISYKYIAKENKCSKGAYFGYFTVANVVFLVILMALWFVIG